MNRCIAVLLAPVLLLGFLAAACGPSASSSPPAPTAAPYKGGARLDFDKRAIDFGTVQYDKLLTATFQLRNVGDQPLVLKNVSLKLVEGC